MAAQTHLRSEMAFPIYYRCTLCHYTAIFDSRQASERDFRKRYRKYGKMTAEMTETSQNPCHRLHNIRYLCVKSA